MGAKSFRELKVWQLAHEVHLALRKDIDRFPAQDRYGMGDQMGRAAYSIGANIVEGFGRRTSRDKARFYTIAMGSAEELKHGLITAHDPGLLPSFPKLWPKLESVCRMLRRLTEVVLKGGTPFDA